MAKGKKHNPSDQVPIPCAHPSEISSDGGGKMNTTERLQENMRNPVNWGKTRSCPARNSQESVAKDVRGTNNGTND